MSTNKYLMSLVFNDYETGKEYYDYNITTPLSKFELTKLLKKADHLLMFAIDYSSVASLIEDYKEIEGEDIPVDVAEVTLGAYEDFGHNPEGVITIATALSRETIFEEVIKPSYDLEVTINC